MASGIDTPMRGALASWPGSVREKVRTRTGSVRTIWRPVFRGKDGRTRLAHKLARAVDMETGVAVSATVGAMAPVTGAA